MARGDSQVKTVIQGIIAIALVMLVVGIFVGDRAVLPEPAVTVPGLVTLASTPVVTLSTLDEYNKGTAVTSQNMYRVVQTEDDGTVNYGPWVDIAGAATLTQASGTIIEIVTGIDTDDESAEPYGAHIESFEIPHKEIYTKVLYVRNDALGGDISTAYFSEYGVANEAQAWAAGNIKTLGIKLTGSFEEDYGNVNVGETSNVIVIRYNNTQVDDVTISSIVSDLGVSYPVTIASVPVIAGSATGYVQKAYSFPVIQSNNGYKAMYVLDGDDTISVNTTISALTFTTYDSGLYLDNNENTIEGGVEDENSVDLGAVAAVAITPSIGA